MNSNEASEFTRWVELANDPSQSEEARQQYRSRMEAYVHRKMREGFQLAAGEALADTPSGCHSAPEGGAQQ